MAGMVATGLGIGLIAGALSYHYVSEYAAEKSKTAWLTTGQGLGHDLFRDFNAVLSRVEALAGVVSTEQQSANPDRQRAIQWIERITQKDPGALGYWVEMLPDQFGTNAAYAGRSDISSTDSGRFSLYALWEGEQGKSPVIFDDAAGPDNDPDITAEDYFAEGVALAASGMLEPYDYEIEGKAVPMTSITSPVLNRDGEIVGLVGADLTLEALSAQFAAATKDFEQVRFSLYSPQGKLLISNRDTAPTSITAGSWEKIVTWVAGKSEPVMVLRDSHPGFEDRVYQAWIPLSIGEANTTFYLDVALEEAVVLNEARRSALMVMGLIGGLILALLMMVSLLLRGSLQRPLEAVVRSVEDLASGNLDGQMPPAGIDEPGKVAAALQTMQRDWKARLGRERLIAGENARIKTALLEAQLPLILLNDRWEVLLINAGAGALLEKTGVAKRYWSAWKTGEGVNAGWMEWLERKSWAIGSETLRWADRLVLVKTSAINDGQGGVVGYLLSLTDISEQKAAETAIETLVQSAAQGNIHDRLRFEVEDPFLKNMSNGLNRLLDAISQSVEEISSRLSPLSEGDFASAARPSSVELHGVFAEMNAKLIQACSELSAVLSEIKLRARDVDACAQEIALGNDDLSRRTESQAAALEETAAAMDELSGTVQQNAAHAKEGLELAVDSRRLTGESEVEMTRVREEIKSLKMTAQKVTDIVGVIDGIAFQTNILSLNAGIEAARAGEHGRGFAVVAREVRSLAQKSSESANDIRKLIQELQERVNQGYEISERATVAMNKAGLASATMEGRMQEIAAASQEQALGIQQVNIALTQMDTSTQQNAALVEEATAAAQSLKEQAASLESDVSRFVLLDGSNPSSPT